ncbi:MAG: hypothetical protein IJ058_14200 [Lachnospiraceae bacterium]|nr:hypothetical protein [Lachnospiraceae bacterium]MBQ8947933.1 hypothetical protein [Lachnospiraceae bacterium]
MATSSIFESVKIKGEDKAAAFMDAYESSLEDARKNPRKSEKLIISDPETLKKVMKKWRKYHVG